MRIDGLQREREQARDYPARPLVPEAEGGSVSGMPLTSPTPTPALVRLLPSMTDLAFLLPVILMFASGDGARYLLADGDTGWHIRTGQWILEHGGVPARDIFSYTRPGSAWFAWEWLWDVGAAGLFRAGGMTAVVLVSLALICWSCALLFRLTRRRCGNSLLALAVMVVAAGGSAVHWLARPHVITIVGTAVFYWLLERVRDERGGGAARGARLLAVLPLLTVLWTNLHGGFFLGLVLVGAYAAGEALTGILSARAAARREAFRRAARYAAAAAACALASLANPYGWRLHAHILAYVRNGYLHSVIMEFKPVDLAIPSAPFFEIMWLLSGGAILWCAWRRRYTEVLLLLGWAEMAASVVRNVPLFMIVAAPIVAQCLGEWLALLPEAEMAEGLRRAAAAIGETTRRLTAIDRIGRWHLTSAAAVLGLALVCWAPAPPPEFRTDFNPRRFPTAAVARLGGEAAGRRIFTIDQWGDYLIYRLYPRTRVYVDGRSDFYGDQFMRSYLKILNVQPGWERLLSRYGVDTILLPTELPLAGAIKESRHWRAVYDDGVAIVFRAAAPEQRTGSAAPAGASFSAAAKSRGTDRDREITKTATRDRTVTHLNPTT